VEHYSLIMQTRIVPDIEGATVDEEAINLERIEVEEWIYPDGFISGEGAILASGHARLNPEEDLGSGISWKLKFATPW